MRPYRVVIEHVSPEVDGGRFAAKRVVGDVVKVEADIYTEGHDLLGAMVRYAPAGAETWQETSMLPLPSDRWHGTFTVTEPGRYRYSLCAWVDEFATWRHGLSRKNDAGQDVSVDLLVGAQLLDEAAFRAQGTDARLLTGTAAVLRGNADVAAKVEAALEAGAYQAARRYPDPATLLEYQTLELVVDPPLARFGAWYELFPRSCAPSPGQHGTFADCEAWLPRIAQLGFDVLYLPPIHPIGITARKGPNNSPVCGPNDPGSPWAIGAAAGGHKTIHPELGTLDDFRHLVAKAQDVGLALALDIAFQCSPDHPYVQEHPTWFRRRPDGSVQYAENPPKRYEDIFPFNFETADWEELWTELINVVKFWHAQGVGIFRVDNPHTKPFPFWERLIAELKAADPSVIFLSEAFTRPRVMYQLAKLGFTQSYNYFPWRNTKTELTAYFEELTKTEVREYLRPSLWPNTPDILTEYLQYGGRSAFMTRLVLAATLGATYGIYGAPYELCVGEAREPGSEEYRDSEKYQLRNWDLNQPQAISEYIKRVNRIRRENPALHQDWNLQFIPVENDQIIAYVKHTEGRDNQVLTVVNLDPHHTQSGWLTLPLDELGLDATQPYQLHDLLADGRYLWSGPRAYVELNPQVSPAQVFQVRRRVRHEHDFEYFL